MDLGSILSDYTYVFLLVLIRYVGLFVSAPIFASNLILNRVKISLALLLAVVTVPVLQNINTISMPDNIVLILLNILMEFLVGFIIGYFTYLSFAAIQLAGQFIDLRMGFAMVNIVDPIRGDSSPLISQFKNILAILLFLAINGHHMLLQTLYQSFKIIPLAGLKINNAAMEFFFRTTGNLFIIAFKIALPVIGTIFVVDVTLGFLARTIPQINFFIIGLPLKIILGFVVLLLSIHVSIYLFSNIFNDYFKDVFKLIRYLR